MNRRRLSHRKTKEDPNTDTNAVMRQPCFDSGGCTPVQPMILCNRDNASVKPSEATEGRISITIVRTLSSKRINQLWLGLVAWVQSACRKRNHAVASAKPISIARIVFMLHPAEFAALDRHVGRGVR